jgi:hypothetical protein
MKVYIATSWKNEAAALRMARLLRRDGHEVDCFCDPSSGRYVFHWTEMVDDPEELGKHDAVSFLGDPRVQRAFREDKTWIDWADAVVMMMPCGNSAHIEAGYAKGRGKRLFIWGPWPKGVFDVMYGFADQVFRHTELAELREALKELS